MRTGLMERINDGGLSMIVATVDQSGMPTCCRAVAVRVEADQSAVTAWVPVATSQAVITNLAGNPRVALVLSAPVSHETIQIKGTSRAVRLAGAEEKEFVRKQMDQLGEVLDQLGLPHKVTSRINRWPAFAIDLTIEHVFDQTPGPKAGRMVK